MRSIQWMLWVRSSYISIIRHNRHDVMRPSFAESDANPKLGGGFKDFFMFTPIWGRITILTNIFQMKHTVFVSFAFSTCHSNHKKTFITRSNCRTLRGLQRSLNIGRWQRLLPKPPFPSSFGVKICWRCMLMVALVSLNVICFCRKCFGFEGFDGYFENSNARLRM